MADAGDLYDEFGNYIGPELSESEEEEEEELEEQQPAGHGEEEEEEGAEAMEQDAGGTLMVPGADEEGGGMAVVLAEDKKYYPTAEETFGAETEALVMEEDAQPLEVPLVAAVKVKRVEVEERAAPKTLYTPEFLASLFSTPELVRNVAVVGHLHHGKTLLMDMLMQPEFRNNEKPVRFTDTRMDEQVGWKAPPTLAPTIPPPSPRLVTELKLPPADAYFKLRHTLAEVNALVALHYGDAPGARLDPALGNVAFGAPLYGFAFTLESFAALYAKARRGGGRGWEGGGGGGGDGARPAGAGAGAPPLPAPSRARAPHARPGPSLRPRLALRRQLYFESPIDPKEFGRRLWGDLYFQPDTRTFRRRPPPGGGTRTFVQFVLEPLYKIFSTVLGEGDAAVSSMLAELGASVRPSSYGMDIKPLLKEAACSIFGKASGLVDMLVRHIPSAKAATANKARGGRRAALHGAAPCPAVARCYTGPQDGELAAHMRACNPRGPLAVYICKLFPKQARQARLRSRPGRAPPASLRIGAAFGGRRPRGRGCAGPGCAAFGGGPSGSACRGARPRAACRAPAALPG
eukprot:scaffold9.g3293.t1